MENLRAVFLKKNSTKTFSLQEFQDMLNLWFHEKGVLTELRLHLRFKLIHILKDTKIGRGINEDNSKSLSLSNQAFNLIVAEHLMQNKYYYSLSIFKTEATFGNVLLDNPVYFGEENQNEFYGIYFDRENISKILDLIGFTQNNPYYEKLLSMYFNVQENKSILSCLTALICRPPELTTEVNDANLSQVVQAMLIGSMLSPAEKEKLNLEENGDIFRLGGVHYINTDIGSAISNDSSEQRNPKERTSLNKNYNSSKINFVQKIEELLSYTDLPSYYVKKVSRNINLFYETKRRQQKKELLDVINQLKHEIASKEMSIKKLHKSKHTLEGQLLKVNKHYCKAKLHLENLLLEENLLHENGILGQRKFKHDEPKDNLRQNSLPSPKEDKIACQLPHCNYVCKENVKLVEDVLNDNMILRKENKKQKDILQKLCLIYKDLLSKFDNFQLKRNFINSTVCKEFTEELLNNYLHGNNLEDELQQNNIEIEEKERDNITEEILHHAGIKFQRLEEETREIEDKFKSFYYS